MTPLEEIKLRIRSKKENAAGQGVRKFMPRDRLQKLLTIDEIASTLTDPVLHIPQHKLGDTRDILFREGIRIFAILLELNLEKKLVAFIEHDLLDSALPLLINDLETVIPEAASSFETLQWDYLAYRFRRGQYHRRVKPKEILPYIEEKKIGGGGFSSVYKVLVHSAHQNLVQDTANAVSIFIWWSSK